MGRSAQKGETDRNTQRDRDDLALEETEIRTHRGRTADTKRHPPTTTHTHTHTRTRKIKTDTELKTQKPSHREAQGHLETQTNSQTSREADTQRHPRKCREKNWRHRDGQSEELRDRDGERAPKPTPEKCIE